MRVFAKEYALISHALDSQESRTRPAKMGNSLAICTVGISNLVCGCILGWRSVAYHFRVTVTLTSDLVFRIIVSGAYLILFEEGSRIWCVGASWDDEVSRTIIGSLRP